MIGVHGHYRFRQNEIWHFLMRAALASTKMLDNDFVKNSYPLMMSSRANPKVVFMYILLHYFI